MTEALHINGLIGEGENTTASVGRFLEANPGAAQIIVNSPGGDAHEGAGIMALVQDHGRVTVQVVGLAASAASLVAVAAKHVLMHSSAHMMIHEPASVIFGTAGELRGEADTLDKLTGTYAEAYSRATGQPVARIRAWMAEETWMTAEEALALNFCDEITGPNERARPVAAFDYTRFNAAPRSLVQLAKSKGWTRKAEV
ncbi:head maturation protease, ClpP-related [Rhodobacter maris]|uniref:ATP-dependent Clp protease proteolytic subunit n=1 Tax=Rhodobacter maris TaxID=446682 RepID=A0A285S4X4_9RHOB|nr:head maturation protease, ClpP-related [Rhodobacter maris]SOC02190.1 ATP-dependent protease ClpP protease subunit [Rhodobacter maris]